MSKNLKRGLIEVGYFLSRSGKDGPPIELKVKSWKDAYSKFYGTFGLGKTIGEFNNSLKNLRDHFDSHLENNRIGWKEFDNEPQQLSSTNQEVFDELQKLSDESVWYKIEPYVVSGYNLSITERINLEIKKIEGKYFSSEFEGKKIVGARSALEANVYHGIVVDNLKLFVESSIENSYAYNTQKIDLALETEGNLRHIYEVKTATDTQSIYTAVGQLFMHSAGISDVEKWIVLPNSFANNDLINCPWHC